jgi:phage shock protein A
MKSFINHRIKLIPNQTCGWICGRFVADYSMLAKENRMSVFRRITNLVSVNVHTLLDWAEDPVRLLAQLIRAMEDELAAARMQAARAIAAERQLRRDLEQHQAAARAWQEQARFALSKNREDLARRALAQKINEDALAAALAPQHVSARELCAKAKECLRALETRLRQARQRQTLLLARQSVARLNLAAERSIDNALHAGDRFDQLEQRLLAKEDETLAQTEVWRLDEELEDALGTMRREEQVDVELRRLREGASDSHP